MNNYLLKHIFKILRAESIPVSLTKGDFGTNLTDDIFASNVANNYKHGSEEFHGTHKKEMLPSCLR